MNARLPLAAVLLAACSGGPPEPPVEGAALLEATTRFFGAQRSGAARNRLREPGQTCFTRDGETVGADLSGGWHDAGDHLKITATTAWAAYVLMAAAERWPAARVDEDDENYGGSANGRADLLDEAAVAVDYLLRVRLDDERLVQMVGDESDHEVFVPCTVQQDLDPALGGEPRRVWTDGAADVAFMAAAALARAARVYGDDPELAAAALDEARALWAFGEAHPGVTDNPFYPSDSADEERWCAAVEIARTTGEELAVDPPGEAWDPPGWSTPTDLCRASAAAAGLPYGEAAWADSVAGYREQVSSEPEVEGLAWFWDWGSLAPAAGAALSAALYAEVTGDADAADFARGQLAWITGANPYDRSFVVGVGENPPERPHHADAYGHADLDTDWSLPFAHELTGAMVGGPTVEAFDVTEAGYADDIEDYVGNEVALDYDAPLVALAAWWAGS